MSFLAQVLTEQRYGSDEDINEFTEEDFQSDEFAEDDFGDDEFAEEDSIDPNEEKELSQVVNKATENPNKQGAIRTVSNAHLVYKREQKDGTYEELWMYKIDDMRKALDIRRDIVAGTDIPVNKMTSPDGDQSYTIWSVGNVEMLNIEGLPH